jgi:hypothetical protein
MTATKLHRLPILLAALGLMAFKCIFLLWASSRTPHTPEADEGR